MSWTLLWQISSEWQHCPLSTFSARAKVSKAIGIIDAQDNEDIETIRRIRNAAAHFDSKHGFNTGFESQSVIALCANLSQAALVANSSARKQFIFAAKTTSGSIMSHVIIAQVVCMHKGYSVALRAVQAKTKDFMYNFADLETLE